MKDDIFGTGACGVNCLTCGLGVSGRCSPRGPGNGPQAAKKLAARLELPGGIRPALKCAVDRNVVFCPRDCAAFPRDRFKSGPYPYGQGFMNMLERRRQGPGPGPRG